ncbi:alpha/beta fold hydrolase, partial [Streptomyces sp. W16]|uniref:alpha/beta fold hydrolase n=1 Tax=Streptomyces sp. W16 TaxID=3076631 RepID=UPI00295B0A9C
ARAGHRVHAVDLIGFPGRSVPVAGRRPRTVADLMTWLDALLDGLGPKTATPAAELGGHSYGGWIALHYALHAPDRTRRLFLLDPTQCFAGFETAYLLHALPMLLRPTARRVRAFLEWGTGGVPLDPDWLRLQEAGVGFPSVKPVTGPRPAPDALRGLNASVLLLLAGSNRTYDTHLVATRAGELLPRVETDILPDVSLPHSQLRSSGGTPIALPHAAPERLGRHLTGFLGP